MADILGVITSLIDLTSRVKAMSDNAKACKGKAKSLSCWIESLAVSLKTLDIQQAQDYSDEVAGPLSMAQDAVGTAEELISRVLKMKKITQFFMGGKQKGEFEDVECKLCKALQGWSVGR